MSYSVIFNSVREEGSRSRMNKHKYCIYRETITLNHVQKHRHGNVSNKFVGLDINLTLFPAATVILLTFSLVHVKIS